MFQAIGRFFDNKYMLRLNLIYYGVHTAQTDARIISIRPEYAIINTRHGLWGGIPGASVLQNAAAYKNAGIKVIGYITAGYEGTGSKGIPGHEWYTLEKNLSLIKNMAEIDKVDGVFIDECSSWPGTGARSYLKTLTDTAHSYGLITWGNTGEAQFNPWFFTGGGFDLMHSSENWDGQSLSQTQQAWGKRISVSGFLPGGSPGEAFKLTAKAWRQGLAYCYITGSTYASLPSWIEEYAKLLR